MIFWDKNILWSKLLKIEETNIFIERNATVITKYGADEGYRNSKPAFQLYSLWI